jgi:hypothetical protein
VKMREKCEKPMTLSQTTDAAVAVRDYRKRLKIPADHRKSYLPINDSKGFGPVQ